jgi:hypothetical protein
MSAFQIFTQPSQQALDSAANVLSGATLTFYLTGTNTPTNAYSDSTLSTPTANPLSANAAGVWIPIFLDPTITYRVVLKTQAGAVLQTWDPANESLLTQALLGRLLNPITAAETAASVTPVNYFWPEGYVDRYGTNTTPGTTDMASATQTAINVANAHANGGSVYFRPGITYNWGSTVTFPQTSRRIHIYGQGAYISVTHNGNGLDWIVQDENYSGHSITDLTITGPNPLAYSPATWTSTGAGINMNRNATTNAVPAYNNVIRNVTVQGFSVGIAMQAAIGVKVIAAFCQFNNYGIYIDGGQTNANAFFGLHVRYNRKAGIRSQGTTGGSLSNATKNSFFGCLIESNIPSAIISGGTPPTDSVGIYLNNSYNFEFYGCYSENQSASIYLTGGSKFNKFIDHRIGSGTGRLDAIYLNGAGVYGNRFKIHADSNTLTEINVISDNADQLYNDFNESTGLNFVSGSILGKLEYADIKPSLAFANSLGYGLVKMPLQGYASNVSSGTTPGCINGIGTGTATLNATGLGEITVGNGITGATSITTVSGLTPNSLFVLRSTQAAFSVTLKAAAFGNAGGQDVIFTASGQVITYWVNGDGIPREIGRNFASEPAYTITNPNARRSYDTTTVTTAQLAEVVGTLLAALKTRGIIS